jgi:hypothetical protein
VAVVAVGLCLAGLLRAQPPKGRTLTEQRGSPGAPNHIIARAESSADAVRLSGELRLTITVEGTAPLRVAVPNPPLTPASAALWKVREVAPPSTEAIPDGRERWRQAFRLFPYASGDAVPLAVAAVAVQAGTATTDVRVEWGEAFYVRVATEVAQPDPNALRPITEIETVAGDDSNKGAAEGGPFSALVALVLLVTAAVVYVRWRRRRRGPAPDGKQVALDTLARLAARPEPGRRFFQELADVMRHYVEYRFETPATRLTTQELLGELRKANAVPDDLATDLQSVLEAGDLAKFTDPVAVASPAVPDLPAQLVERGQRFVDRTSPTPAAPR